MKPKVWVYLGHTDLTASHTPNTYVSLKAPLSMYMKFIAYWAMMPYSSVDTLLTSHKI